MGRREAVRRGETRGLPGVITWKWTESLWLLGFRQLAN